MRKTMDKEFRKDLIKIDKLYDQTDDIVVKKALMKLKYAVIVIMHKQTTGEFL